MSSSESNFANSKVLTDSELASLANHIKAWGMALGFQQVGICDIDVRHHDSALRHYIEMAYQGQMDYLARNTDKRLAPDSLHENTCRIVSVRMNYLPPDAGFAKSLANDKIAYVSRYALGRDYHKVMRQRLKKLGEKIKDFCEHLDYRPFVDSAPVLEHAVAEKAGIGWTGKHTLTLNEEAGSWFFLGELFINIPVPIDEKVKEQCGSCNACISICPTQAIVAPYKLDARKCISYLTIEHKGEIPLEFRQAIGNRIYGCDDCQLVCPWNRYADITEEKDFFAREKLNQQDLLSLFAWTEEEFLTNTQGSPIRRIGFQSWQRNLSIGMGNASFDSTILNALEKALIDTNDPVLRSHFEWAIQAQLDKKDAQEKSISSRQHQRLIRVIKKGLPRDA
ncbi:tRNA epoxyqueuosine(34) reductase QueG [Glaciecola petra]|uniref:Epoxyqueuosine reductase n=1 Tax=Glaciecola petra TaxID=3075602 RepID=A0ABU2ZU78_9ALTE|nr:tRNA epoxyqueuosine(34) reductase QueG [Aestuariibacter sp. P117]MDT0596190.1 tRNA epoxyqueuosine(34) reductase QueG [Aestuariibacter sp. P117]